MRTKQLKTWKDYWRVTLYLDQREHYRLIQAAAESQNVNPSQWLKKHAIRLARRELKQAQGQESIQSLLRGTKAKEPAA